MSAARHAPTLPFRNRGHELINVYYVVADTGDSRIAFYFFFLEFRGPLNER